MRFRNVTTCDYSIQRHRTNILEGLNIKEPNQSTNKQSTKQISATKTTD